MTTFHFRLQRVLEFRRMQFQLAESECQRAAAQVHALQAQQTALATRKAETRRAFARLPEIAGQDLAPLPGWYNWTVRANHYLTQMEQAAQMDLNKRRDALIQARQKLKLLEKLREKREKEWKAALDQEVDELAEDSTNSRIARSRA
jgi:flagellar export protein FliJ